MKIGHWTTYRRSGQSNVVESLCREEIKQGLDSRVFNMQEVVNWDDAKDCDIHVSHTHYPDHKLRSISTKPYKLVWVGHAGPEHLFQSAVETGQSEGYGHGDPWMLLQHWLQVSDARVTFWERYVELYESWCDKGIKVYHVPLGIDKSYWNKVPSRGKYLGEPSVFVAESQLPIKWNLDLFIMWGPWIIPNVNTSAVLHAVYIKQDLHRWYFPLINRNGTSYGAHISSSVLDADSLRNAYVSCDYQVGFCRYGDFNMVSLEANACGMKTISYRGNKFSDFWIHEGDSRVMAKEMVDILNGVTKPRDKTPVPDIGDTVKAMKVIYESIA